MDKSNVKRDREQWQDYWKFEIWRQLLIISMRFNCDRFADRCRAGIDKAIKRQQRPW